MLKKFKSHAFLFVKKIKKSIITNIKINITDNSPPNKKEGFP